MKFYTRYNPPQGSVIDQTGQTSRTVQSEKDNCDINQIMERFNRTGKLPIMQTLPPHYGDARVVDFQTAQSIVKEATEQFYSLPALTRKHFGNDPQAFLEALKAPSEEEAQKLLKLGILVQREEKPEKTLQRIAENTKKEPQKAPEKT